MNDLVRSILSILQPAVPTIAAMLPIPAIFSNAIGAMGQALLNKATATPEEVVAAVKADPAKATEALKPLDDHLAKTTSAVAEGATTVPKEELPAATKAVTEAILFASDDREVVIGPADKDGRSILSIYLTVEQVTATKL